MSLKMRFVILTQYFPPEIGAPQIRLAAVIRELLRLGHQVEVVTALPNYPQGEIFKEYRGFFYKLDDWEGIKVHRVWMYAAMGAGIKRLLSYFSFMFTALWGLRKVQPPDYLFVESPPLFLGITGYWMAKRWHCRLILNIADLWPDFVRGVGLMQNRYALGFAEKLEHWLYQRADAINIVTQGMQDILIEKKKKISSG
jgi:glycosyltransferase involved in cell wall biosynthesis